MLGGWQPGGVWFRTGWLVPRELLLVPGRVPAAVLSSLGAETPGAVPSSPGSVCFLSHGNASATRSERWAPGILIGIRDGDRRAPSDWGAWGNSSLAAVVSWKGNTIRAGKQTWHPARFSVTFLPVSTIWEPNQAPAPCSAKQSRGPARGTEVLWALSTSTRDTEPCRGKRPEMF